MKKKVIVLCMLFILCVVPAVALADDYVIGDGDVLEISVWGSKELSLSVIVRPDGKITVPGIGDVTATGLTPPALQTVLSEKLKELVKSPVVTVIVKDIKNNMVFVFGGGVKSGSMNLSKRTSLLELICMIGDTNIADWDNSYVMRNGVKIKENFYKLFKKGDVSENVPIERNDIIFIPAMTEKYIYVLGAVNAPKFIVYREDITVLEAIIEGGGFTKFAKENSTVIVRKGGDKESTIPVRAKDLIEKGDFTQNVKLKPGDYVIAKEGLF